MSVGSMAAAIDAIETSVLQRDLVHDGNPVLTWNISNAMAVENAAGDRKLDKSKTRFRIDGAQALAMAVGLKSRDTQKEDRPSVYRGKSPEEIAERMSF